MLEFIDGKKTYITLGLLVLVCVAELFGLDVVPGIDKSNALQTAWGSVAGIFMRQAIA